MALAKVEKYPGVSRLAPEHIEKNETEQQLRAAQFKLDRMLHDLRAEFIHREGKLRDDFLAEVQQITGEQE